jgi:hypothetical protein
MLAENRVREKGPFSRHFRGPRTFYQTTIGRFPAFSRTHPAGTLVFTGNTRFFEVTFSAFFPPRRVFSTWLFNRRAIPISSNPIFRRRFNKHAHDERGHGAAKYIIPIPIQTRASPLVALRENKLLFRFVPRSFELERV